MSSPFTPPADALGADLFWWRREGGLRTLITIYGPMLASQLAGDRFRLLLAVFDVTGRLQASGETSLGATEVRILDQARLAAIVSADVDEGVLAVFPVGNPIRDDSGYVRLGSLCDWFTDEGELVSFHNDQSWLPGVGAIELTEIVILAEDAARTELAIANGPEPLAAGCLRVWVQNHRGQQRYATHAPAIAPFSLARIGLQTLFPGLDAFLEGRAATVSGRLASRDLFVRPWVVTSGPRLAAYHGGNRNRSRSLHGVQNLRLPYRLAWLGDLWPRAARFLAGAPMNPGAVIHRGGLTTTVSVLNSHGDLEDDFWLDVRLHDAAGRLVAERERWLLATRNGVARADIGDLLPDPSIELVGHAAFTFSRAAKRRFPWLLQVLFEYRTKQSTARSMLWGDHWNSPARLRNQGIALRAFYRAVVKPPLSSHVIVSNCGMAADYDRAASFRLVLEDGAGKSLVHEATLPPHGTLFASVIELFPEARRLLGDRPGGVLVVESAFDLASMHFTLHEGSGVWSAEHNLPLHCLGDDGSWHVATGS
jgi:hypothetical protein